jgi:YD repeat-containing protein
VNGSIQQHRPRGALCAAQHLTISRTSGTGVDQGNITSVSGRYGRSVYYQVASYSGGGGAGTWQEVDHASQIVTTGTSSPPDRYAYGYTNITNGEGSETVPALHTITVPSPTGSGTSTATINYGSLGAGLPAYFVSSLVDAEGNTRTYTEVDANGNTPSSGTYTNYTRVTVTNAGSAVVYAYTAQYDSQMRTVSVTDGNQQPLFENTFGTTDSYDPVTVQDADSLYSAVPGTSGNTFPLYGTDRPSDPNWEIRLNGSVVGSSTTTNGWWVYSSSGTTYFSVPSGATAANHYEMRYNTPSGTYSGAYFDVVSAARGTTQYVYDQYGHVHQTTSARGTVTDYTWAFSVLGELVTTQTSGRAPTNITYYEPSGNIETITSPVPGTQDGTGYVTSSYTYDSLGNVLTAATPGNNAVTSITSTLNYTPDGTYSQSDAIAQPVTVTDNLGKVTHLRYDSRGKCSTVSPVLSYKRLRD